MKSLFASAAFAALITSVSFSAQAQREIEVKSEVEEAVVYLNGAVVTRSADVNLQAGESTLVFTGITNTVNPSSIQVSGGQGYVITGTRHRTNFSKAQKEPAEVRAKRDSLEDAQFSKRAKEALRATYGEELQLLQANRQINGEQTVLLVEDVEDMADFYRERVKEIKYKTLELEEEEKELQQLIMRLQNELQQMRGLRRKDTSEILVKIDADRSQKATIEVSYYSYDAAWVPVYDLRSDGTDQPVSVTVKGKVRQNTGNDWSGVKLTFSSGDPSTGGNPPELQPWRLYPEATYEQRSTKSAYRMDEADYEVVEYAAPLIDRDGGASQSMVSRVNVQEKVLAAKWMIEQPYDVPSDNQLYEVELQNISMPADYRHFAVPKLGEDTYLVADVTEWEQYSLLPGDASIYFEGDYVGKSFIDPFIATDTLQLSFGRDPGVVVKREQVKDYCRTKTLGLKKETSRGYRITVMNTRPVPVTVRIEDQIPISTDGSIEVSADELSKGEYDPATGKVTWNLSIPAGDTAERMLRFSVKYPRKTKVGNL
jgi:uncharacterized protein (TIGR02231 family)